MVRFRNLRAQGDEDERPPEGEEAQPEGEEEALPEEAGEGNDLDLDTADDGDDLDLEGEEGAGGDAATAEPAADGPDGSDGSDPALKELAARMAVLQSNLEGVQESRSSLEEKLSTMEERMTRLGSLAEAVSTGYNPFVAENEPGEPDWANDEAAAEAATPAEAMAPAQRSDPAPQPAEREPEPAPPAVEPTQPAPPSPTPAPSKGEDEVDPLAAALAGLGGTGGNGQGLDALKAAEAIAPELGPDAASMLEQNFLLLEWVGLMLRRVGRAGLLDLLEYYQALGWLDRPIKDRVIRVAVGVDAPDRTGDGEWRGDVDLHERSLVTILRLKGEPVTKADVEGLHMEMRRFFGE